MKQDKKIPMKTVTIMLAYLSGPIWPEYYDEETDTESTGVDIVDNDEKLRNIAKKISDMFNSYYIID